MSISKWIDKEVVVPRHNGILFSHIKKNKIMPFAATWTDLKTVMLSEARKRHTISYSIIHMWKSYKKAQMNLSKKQRVRDVENKLMVRMG